MIRILIGDCMVRMKELADCSVDSVVCDPPYHLTSIVKRFGKSQMETNAIAQPPNRGAQFKRLSKGFMGQTWDGGDVAFQPETWAEVLRVLKPGGHLVAFSGTRTYHRMAVAIEDAGFEVRDMIAWHYGSGFPKSHDISKAIDKARDDSADGAAVGAWLKAQRESKGLKQKEVAALWPSITGGLTGCVANWETLGKVPKWDQWLMLKEFIGFGDEMDVEVWRLNGRKGKPGEVWQKAEVIGECVKPKSTYATNNIGGKAEANIREIKAANSDAAREWEGWGTALKPATEPICLARKPLSEKTITANVLKWGTGALNIDGCRVATDDDTARKNNVAYGLLHEGRERQGGKPFDGGGHEQGRWPANLCHDGSDEVVAGFPNVSTGICPANASGTNRIYGEFAGRSDNSPAANGGDSGSAARFFYTAKATTAERGEGNNHPTVKPVALMRWLVRLVTPKGGTVLDPFMGSGSTALACDAEQFDFIGCELSPEYAAIAERRIRDAAGMFAQVETEKFEAAA